MRERRRKIKAFRRRVRNGADDEYYDDGVNPFKAWSIWDDIGFPFEPIPRRPADEDG